MQIEKAKDFCDECISQISILENEKFGKLLLSSIQLSILNSQNIGYDIALKISDSKKNVRFFNGRGILFAYSTPRIVGSDYQNHQIACFHETQKLIEEFYSIPENQVAYSSLSSFNAYLNSKKSKEELDRYLIAKNYTDFNFNTWIQYFVNLFSFFYSDYKIQPEISDKKEMYFFKESQQDTLLGFSLNLKEMKSDIRKGTLCLQRPQLVLLHNNKGTLSFEKLGDFIHPYFSLFVQLQSFQFLLTQDDLDNIVYADVKKPQLKTMSDGKIEICGDEQLAEKCKKMAFFQMSLESKYNLQYISFLEKIYCSNLILN